MLVVAPRCAEHAVLVDTNGLAVFRYHLVSNCGRQERVVAENRHVRQTGVTKTSPGSSG
jgi:hypothetical protein